MNNDLANILNNYKSSDKISNKSDDLLSNRGSKLQLQFNISDLVLLFSTYVSLFFKFIIISFFIGYTINILFNYNFSVYDMFFVGFTVHYLINKLTTNFTKDKIVS